MGSANREPGTGHADPRPREHTADQRDSLADAREAEADDRDSRADQRETLADQRETQADQRDVLADRREARVDSLLRDSGLTTTSVQQRAHEAITRSRQLIARSAAAMDRCEALLRRQAQRAGREQSAT